MVIQGPPGTGKTYVGLKIAHCLLQNARIWQLHSHSNILIVCYTNHALDQFVEGLLQYGHENLIRCGGRCNNDAVKKYTLKEKIASSKENGIHPPHEVMATLWSISDCLKERKLIEEDVENSTRKIDHVSSLLRAGRIIPLQQMLSYLPKHLIGWFKRYNDANRVRKLPFLEVYLGLLPLPLEEIGNVELRPNDGVGHNSINEQMTSETDEYSRWQEQHKELIDVEGDAEELIDRWVIDENEYAKVRQRPPQTRAESNQMIEMNQFSLVDANGFQYVMPSMKDRRSKARRYWKTIQPMTEEQVNGVTDPSQLSHDERWMLYKYLVNAHVASAGDNLVEQCNRYDRKCAQIKELNGKRDEYYLRESDVIAMTTTCAARYRLVLARIRPQIIIIEEAAEVLEAHVITSLTEDAEHLILIGDHKQLKPKPSVYRLAKDYNLELSLFERMIENGVDCHRLDIQHRMRPEIAHLLADIYPNLENHVTVENYPDVLGVSSNLHFISHSFQEDSGTELRSKSNKHEAEFIVALCRYLLLQGYSPNQITILTLYTGQLLVFKELMPKEEFADVRVACVDNFQGEECEIVLLSLVRSNDAGAVGFAQDENRVCVSLSRAKIGLFVIGNFELLASKSRSWTSVVNSVKRSGHFGKHLSLYCRNHPERTIEATRADNFRNAPAGGCKLPCLFRLNCGHVCEKACHPVDQEHLKIDCTKSCDQPMLCGNDHFCKKKCHHGTNCGPCIVKVTKLVPDCNHEQQVPCSKDPSDFLCSYPIERLLHCGHNIEVECHSRNAEGIRYKEPSTEILQCGIDAKGIVVNASKEECKKTVKRNANVS